MSNMSYCRFQNTASDFSDCVEHITDTDLFREEQLARIHLVNDAITMLEELGIEVDLGKHVSVERLLEEQIA